jgi:hypothetical protein
MRVDVLLARIRSQGDARSGVRGYGLDMDLPARAQVRVGTLVDWLPALLLVVAAQLEVWSGGEASARRVADALVLLVVTVPLAWRRHAPATVVSIVTVSSVLGFAFLDGYGTPLVAILLAV